MCLIALTTSKFAELSASFWEQACAANTHGLGLMYHDGFELVAIRTIQYDVPVILALIEKIPPGIRAALHLREATRGTKCVRNAHPHTLVSEGFPLFELHVMHNGCVTSLPADLTDGPSDTALMVDTWMRPKLMLDPPRWSTPEFLAELSEFAGPHNRFVLLDERGQWRIVGKQEGFVCGETWLSNTRARPWLA